MKRYAFIGLALAISIALVSAQASSSTDAASAVPPTGPESAASATTTAGTNGIGGKGDDGHSGGGDGGGGGTTNSNNNAAASSISSSTQTIGGGASNNQQPNNNINNDKSNFAVTNINNAQNAQGGNAASSTTQASTISQAINAGAGQSSGGSAPWGSGSGGGAGGSGGWNLDGAQISFNNILTGNRIGALFRMTDSDPESDTPPMAGGSGSGSGGGGSGKPKTPHTDSSAAEFTEDTSTPEHCYAQPNQPSALTYDDSNRCNKPSTCNKVTDKITLYTPRDQTVEAGANTTPTPQGTGAAYAKDVCGSTKIMVCDKYMKGIQNCADSKRIIRTFTATNRCPGYSVSGTQNINIVDHEPPSVRARLVPLPPLAVTASQLQLTPMQMQDVILTIIKVGEIGVGIDAMTGMDKLPIIDLGQNSDNKMSVPSMGSMGSMGGKGMSMGTSKQSASGIASLLGRFPAGSPLSNVFGSGTAKLLSNAGFGDLSSVINVLNGDFSGLSDGSMGQGLRTVQVFPPAQNSDDPMNNDKFKDFLKSNVALPIGVQSCRDPSTRLFYVNCTARDDATPDRRLKASAILRVTHITNRNSIGVKDPKDEAMKADQQSMNDEMRQKQQMNNFDPMKMGMGMGMGQMKMQMNDPMKGMKDPMQSMQGMKNFDPMNMKNMGDMFHPASVPGSDSGSGSGGDNSSDDSDMMDLSHLPGGQMMDFNSMVNGGADPNQVRNAERAQNKQNNKATNVLAIQCSTHTDVVHVHCGDVVSITLEAEDSCLAQNFDPMNHDFMTDHMFNMNDFDGGSDGMKRAGFTSQGFVTNTTFHAKAVRGTAVALEVVVKDECHNLGRDRDDPSRDCEAFVSGKCCAPIVNGLSQYVTDRVLFGQDDGMMHMPQTAPVQLTDVIQQFTMQKFP